MKKTTTRIIRSKSPRKPRRAIRAKAVRASNFTQDVISQAIGEQALPVVSYLKGKKNISEFVIAKGIKYEVRDVRKTLYALQNRNLVTYFRKKDREKGWYISYWTFNPPGVGDLALAMKRNKLSQLRERLSKEEENEGQFYICPNLCSRLEFEAATEVEFRCPECGRPLTNQDNTRTIETIRKSIVEIEAN
jgi:transcription initiation factor TFIIE subunit alpha